MRHCEWCGRFVAKNHLRTARYCYDVSFGEPVSVYSLATASRLLEQLLCPTCSRVSYCCRMREAARGYGVAIGPFPGGWEKCTPETTAADYAEVAS